MCLHFKIKLNSRPLIYGFIAMGIWGGLQIAVFQRPASPIVFIELFVAYTIFSLYKKDLPARFEHISVKMAILSLVLWAICLVAYEPLYALAKAVGSPGANISQSLYIFSVPHNFEDNRGFLLRNCGYSWEPGRIKIQGQELSDINPGSHLFPVYHRVSHLCPHGYWLLHYLQKMESGIYGHRRMHIYWFHVAAIHASQNSGVISKLAKHGTTVAKHGIFNQARHRL